MRDDVSLRRHRLLERMPDGRPRYWSYHFIWALLSVMCSSSAYPVYRNTAWGLPISVSFFWFSFFACLGAFIYPNDATTAFLQGTPPLTFRERWKLLYPESPLRRWSDSLKKGGLYLIGVSAFTYVIQFLFLLAALKLKQTGVVITVLVLQQFTPLLHAALSNYFFNDRMQNWRAYVIGVLCTAFGVGLYQWYRLNPEGTQSVRFFDTVTLYIVVTIILTTVSILLRFQYRRAYGIDGLEAVRTTQVVAVAIGFIFALFSGFVVDGTFLDLSADQFFGLAYLGFVPTAYGSIVLNRAQDYVGIPVTSCIFNIRPFWVMVLSLLPLAWFKTDLNNLNVTQSVGVVISIIGLMIVFLMAKPTIATSPNKVVFHK